MDEDTQEICTHLEQPGRFCNQCGARLGTAARKRESFRDSLVTKPAPEGDVK